MLSSLPAPGGVHAGKSGKYELPFRRGSDGDSGASDDANRVRRGGQLGAAGVAPFARLPARFNTASRPMAAATWRPKEPRSSVLPTGSPIGKSFRLVLVSASRATQVPSFVYLPLFLRTDHIASNLS
jgi:hypothetical protein